LLKAILGEPGKPLAILCLGAHCDDIEVGVGGTVLRLLAERPGSTVHWVVFASDTVREAEARASAAAILSGAANPTVEVFRFRDSFLPHAGAEIKERFEALKGSDSPDLIFTHRLEDRHQDHRVISELTWNTFRDHLVAEYEIPKYEGDLGQPNTYVPLTESTARRKIELLLRHYPSQAKRSWFRSETFEALMRLRAIECNSETGFAEALYVRKITI
jgi:LmbE family N-acetylglucosaminyl deacetylase